MHIRTLSCALGVVAMTFLSTPLFAHGGLYRGPQDVVPPPGGGGSSGRPSGGAGPTTGGPRGPGAPTPGGSGPSRPGTGGQRNPGSGSSPGPRTGGMQLTADLSTWRYWWEFNKHSYIGLREAIHQAPTITGSDVFWLGASRRPLSQNMLAPTNSQIHEDILPSLKRAIDSTDQRDIVSSCMVAMAKIGQDHDKFKLVDVFAPRLARGNQEIRETAALAMGISAVPSEKALDNLVALACNNAAGQKLSNGKVSNRTRSFALYGLGLYANEHSAPSIKRRALTAMLSVLKDTSRERNIKVAAIQGIGMLAIDRVDLASQPLMDEALDALLTFYTQKSGMGLQLVQSHCPTAIMKLLGPNHTRSDEFRQRFAAELDGQKKHRRGHDLSRSAVLALGQMCDPYDSKTSVDASYSKLLMATYNTHKDGQTRYFSLLSLGQIGGKENRRFLLRILDKGNKQLERPWAALALGVQAFETYQDMAAKDAPLDPDELVGEALFEQLKSAKSPELVGALGVALGLTRYVAAAPEMQKRMVGDIQKTEQAGYLCLGLALMRHQQSREVIQQTMAASSRRPTLFVQAAIALGVLGDKSAAAELHKKFGDEDSNLATLSAIAEALGQIGDRRSIAPLKHALFDEDRGDLQRAFAAVSLGAVADRAMLPWHSKISKNINYRAAVETLTNQQSGVLDIL
ncbi:MAG: HEAT repeat protein [Planctomycetota bacterium]|jgi:HEAT repeat protein